MLFLLSLLAVFTSFSMNSVLAIEGKCVGGPGPQGNFLTRAEGGCCLNDECCNYPATQAWCNRTKKDLVPFKDIESYVENDEDLFKDKGKVIGKTESLEGKVEVKQEDGTWKQLKVGDEVKFLDHIRVGKIGNVKIKLIDDTSFTISENSYSVIDEFFYDPNQSFLERTYKKYFIGTFEWIHEKLNEINKELNKRFQQRNVESAAAVRG